MTRDDIIRMAQEAGLYVGTNISGVRLVGSTKNDNGLLIHMEVDELARFAALVADRERDALLGPLKEAGLFLHHAWCDIQMNEYSFEKLNKTMEVVDAAIRARSNT